MKFDIQSVRDLHQFNTKTIYTISDHCSLISTLHFRNMLQFHYIRNEYKDCVWALAFGQNKPVESQWPNPRNRFLHFQLFSVYSKFYLNRSIYSDCNSGIGHCSSLVILFRYVKEDLEIMWKKFANGSPFFVQTYICDIS